MNSVVSSFVPREHVKRELSARKSNFEHRANKLTILMLPAVQEN